MAIFRCKMCGGDLEVPEGASFGICEFCGTKQTLPTSRDENLQGLFNRANVLRMKSEFDKAAEIYEKILQTDQTEAEAYWGLILCKYGIEYVEDPTTYKRIPTCHRASYDAVTADEDYKNALKYADAVQKEIYEKEAAKIDEIQKGILEIAQKESPYDVFICYKETDDSGNRTQDSVIANDIYYQLTNEGMKVFYAAISLEDKLGSEYEPIIFSALNSSKVMLVLGTKPEYFNAVWVKNEWSRFLKLMKKDRTRLMIPCYRDMDPYELPEEFAHLQAQNMEKIGFINDLVRNIRKIINPETPGNKMLSGYSSADSEEGDIEKLLERGKISIEDHEWNTADAIFEQVLSKDVYCARAYYGKFLAKYMISGDQSLYNYLSAKNGDIHPRQEISDIPIDFSSPSSHVQAMVNQYTVPGFLPYETIVSLYRKPVLYNSVLSDLTAAVNSQYNIITTDRGLSRAYSYADDDLKKEINTLITSLQQKANDLIMNAKANDDICKQNALANFMNQTDQTVIQMNQAAFSNLESVYQSCVAGLQNTENIEIIKYYKSQFESIRWYKDSEDYIIECEDSIKSLENEEKKKRTIKDLKYTLWIAPIALFSLSFRQTSIAGTIFFIAGIILSIIYTIILLL